MILAGCVLSMPAVLGQTAASTEYFLDNNAYIYRLNPALSDPSSRFFFGVLAPHLTVAASSNVGVSDLLFPMSDGSLVTGLNSQVPSSDFLGGLKENNALRLNADVNLLSIGRYENDHLTTVEVNLRSNTSCDIPKSVFSLLKEGTQGYTYSAPGLDVRTSNWLEAAIGHGVTDGPFSYGFRIKFMAGLADVSLHMDEMSATPSSDGVSIDAAGTLKRAEPLFNDDGSSKQLSLSSLSPMGLGAGVDLGFAYNGDRFRVDAALLDLGAIRWHNSMYGDFTYREMLGSDASVGEVLSTISPDTPAGAHISATAATVNVGGRYFVNDWFSAGLFYTGRLDGGWSDARAGVTLTPGSALSFAASAGVSQSGVCCGAALNLRIPGLMLHVAVDDVIFEFTPQYVPVNAFHTAISAGLAIVI